MNTSPILRVFMAILAVGVAVTAAGQDVFRTIKYFGSTSSSLGLPGGALLEGTNGALFGVAQIGGDSDNGAVFRVNKDGSGLASIKSFGAPSEGLDPNGSLLLASDGLLYGMMTSGGTSNLGTIFRINQDGSGFMLLKNLTGGPNDGTRPVGALILATNGLLYGATQLGGTGNLGTLFMLHSDGSGYTLLRSFTGLGGEGTKPAAGLIQGIDGALYGTASQGGAANRGGVFALNPDGSGFRMLKSFTGTGGDGFLPAAALVQGPDGTLYGTTYLGGTLDKGTLFKLNPDGTGYQVLKSLGGANGVNPQAALIFGTNGVLYGTTLYGGSSTNGTVFQINPDGSGFRVLKSYSGTGTDGELPLGGLLQGSDGSLYGVTGWGGTYGTGTAFKLNLDGTAYSVLVNFNDDGGDGINPAAPVVTGADGYLYGSTQQGGTNNQGTIFKLNKDGTGYRVLKSFTGTGDGANPVAGLLPGSDGALYGTTSCDHDSGGIVSGFGTVFKISADGTNYQVLHHFLGGTDGANPLYGTLVQATDGMLYGTTMNGGTSSQGTVFRINPNGSNYVVLKKFAAGNEGYHPYGGVIQAVDGALYGTTSIGGAGGQGTIFKMNLDGSGFAVLHGFSGPDGGGLYASLIQGKDGAFYGTTAGGGTNGNGAIFQMRPDGSGFTVLKHLDINSGVIPLAPLIQGASGALYGTTSFRGNPDILLGAGTVFQLNADGSAFRVLKVFTQTGEGYAPKAALMQAPDGTLYGTASSGGRGGNLDGTLFSLMPAPMLSTITLGQSVQVRVAGLSGRAYRIQRATAPGQGWVDVSTITAGADGTCRYVDTNPTGASAFYRAAQP